MFNKICICSKEIKMFVITKTSIWAFLSVLSTIISNEKQPSLMANESVSKL